MLSLNFLLFNATDQGVILLLN